MILFYPKDLTFSIYIIIMMTEWLEYGRSLYSASARMIFKPQWFFYCNNMIDSSNKMR